MKELERRLLGKVAHLYYIEEKTQAEIALELDLYRTTVSRMLTKAKKEKIVQINIQGFDSSLLELGRYFKKKYALQVLEVLEEDAGESLENRSRELAVLAAKIIRKTIKNNQSVGVAWGSTLASVIEEIERKTTQGTTFVPLAGGPSRIHSNHHVNTLVYELGQKFQGGNIFINASVVQENPLIAQGIMQAKYFFEIKNYWDKLDVALLGAGGILNEQIESQWRDLLTSKDYQDLNMKNVVGDCCCRFFDSFGREVRGELAERTISISLSQLKRVPKRILVAYGKEKSQSILALMRGKYINHLICDQETLMDILRIENREMYERFVHSKP